MIAPDEMALSELDRDRREYYDAMWDVLDQNWSLKEMGEWQARGVRLGHA